MAELTTVTKNGSEFKFVIENSDKGKEATYCFKTGAMHVDGKQKKSLRLFFSSINGGRAVYWENDSSSIKRVLNRCEGNIKVFFEYVYAQNSNCSSFATMLERFPDYRKQEEWINFLGKARFPLSDLKEFNKLEKKKLLNDDDYLYDARQLKVGYLRVKDELELKNKENPIFFEREYDYNEGRYMRKPKMSSSQLINFVDLVNLGCDKETLYNKLEYYTQYEGLKPRKAMEYLSDYIHMNKQMNRSFTKYPRMLSSSHDIVVMIHENYKKEFAKDEFDVVKRPELEYLQKGKDKYTKDEEGNKVRIPKYQVLVPQTPDDIKKEGLDLHHCVGSYIQRIIDKRTYICFVRFDSNLNESLLTVEVREDRVAQISGFGNRSPSKLERDFLSEWAKEKSLRYM